MKPFLSMTLDEACLLAREFGQATAVLYEPDSQTIVIVVAEEEIDNE